MTRQVRVTIGRNIGDHPMPWEEWERFQTGVRGALRPFGTPNVVQHGIANSAEYGTEIYASFVVADADCHHKLSDNLARLARRHGQDSIAVEYGTVEFVKGERHDGL